MKPPIVPRLKHFSRADEEEQKSPVRRSNKLAELYETTSANGGDPAQSYRSSRRSARSEKQSQLDLKLKQMQNNRNSICSANESEEEGSSCAEEDLANGGTLVISRSDKLKSFSCGEDIQKGLKKKLKRLETIAAFESNGHTFKYEAAEFLAKLI